MNVICAMIFGSRYDIEDKEFLSIVDSNVTFVRAFEYDNLVDIFPLLRLLPNKRLKMIKKALAVREPVLVRQLREHRMKFDGDNVHDLTDALIKAAQEATHHDKEVSLIGPGQTFQIFIQLSTFVENAYNSIMKFLINLCKHFN